MNIENLYQIFLESSGISTDTRTITQNNLFFALSGPNFNGNKFAAKALENGAKYAVVDDEEYANHSNCILVENSLKTLQDLATYHRNQLDIPIIAITGSNGKTSTKELMHKVLDSRFNTYATKGNLNNHIGVPLSLLEVQKGQHEMAIIEMGANHQKEIESYCKWASPTHGLITNIGKAHLEGFGGIQGVIKGKTELYHSLAENNGVAFYNAESEILKEKVQEVEKHFSYGLNNQADFSFELLKENPSIELKFSDYQLSSSLFGAYNAINIMAAVSVGLFFNVPFEAIHQAIGSYTSENNRSEIVKKGNIEIVLDAYNANPSSMKLALETFAARDVEDKMVILGDMFELGESAEEEHKKMLELLINLKIENAILVGKEFKKHQSAFSFSFYKKTADLLNWLDKNTLSTKLLLVKGSRAMQLEKVLEKLG